MAATAITCPRCKGDGEISVKVTRPGEEPEHKVGACPLCRGKGLASWSEPMGAPVGRASRGAP